VQPIVALAVRLRERGHDARLCVPPNLVAWVRSFGFDAVPVGVEMRVPTKREGGGPAVPLTPEQLRPLRASMPDLITDQFDAVGAAAQGCHVLLGANAHQYAARSIAELRGIPYATAVYAPVALPSSDHPPPPGPGEIWALADAATHAHRWAAAVRAWNERALERVNHNRVLRGLTPIDDVLRHNLTDGPWLAADGVLAPVPATPGVAVLQTGAWVLEDHSELAPEIEAFLAAGEPPIYVGFGSMPAPPGLGDVVVEAVRAMRRRAILSSGWAELDLELASSDTLVVGDTNQQALFPRLAAVVHHGGAGTTAAAARAGVPQVVAPMFGDQFYWASRVRALGIGTAVMGSPARDGLASSLEEALDVGVVTRAHDVASRLRADGAMVAAREVERLGGLGGP
jgi:vancomycin aglycone glucosyltransferase